MVPASRVRSAVHSHVLASRVRLLAGTIDDLGYHDSADALASFTFRLLRWALTCGFGIPEDVYLPLDDVSLSIHKLT